MSTVKIKTESTTTTAAVDVQVKLEPSLSTADIKPEQHTSDIDTKVESDSDTDSEEDIKSESDDDTDLFTITPKIQRQVICKHSGCGRSFNSMGDFSMHRHEHKLQTELTILGKRLILARQSLNDRWPCPITDCETTFKTVKGVYRHLRATHDSTLIQQQQQQQQQSPAKKTRSKWYFVDVDDFYVNGVRCAYHTKVGVFICHDCRLVPECLLTHMQQKHGYNEKSIDNATLPESAVNAGTDINGNQHTSNPHLVAAISQSCQWRHRDIIHGWLCVTSDCGYCNYTADNKGHHRRKLHQGEQLTTVPALVLRLCISKAHACYFLITPIGQTSSAVTTNSNKVSQHKLDYSQDESGDDADQNQTMESSHQKRHFICGFPNCKSWFNSSNELGMHQCEHKLEVVVNVRSSTFVLTRQSADDRWLCPIPDCVSTAKTVNSLRTHMRNVHSKMIKHKRANCEDDANQQQQHHLTQVTRNKRYYFKVDDFYIKGTRCGYHTTTGVFICHECRLVPECLLTHLLQKHGYDEKSIDSSSLPESAINAGTDHNANQHTSNSHLVLLIREPYQWRHPDIIHGWLCVASDCGNCYSSKRSINEHQRVDHEGEQISTVPALVLRLLYGRTQTSSFLITRLDTAADRSINSNNNTNQQENEHKDDDDGDELVLSDYSDENDIY